MNDNDFEYVTLFVGRAQVKQYSLSLYNSTIIVVKAYSIPFLQCFSFKAYYTGHVQWYFIMWSLQSLLLHNRTVAKKLMNVIIKGMKDHSN